MYKINSKQNLNIRVANNPNEYITYSEEDGDIKVRISEVLKTTLSIDGAKKLVDMLEAILEAIKQANE